MFSGFEVSLAGPVKSWWCIWAYLVNLVLYYVARWPWGSLSVGRVPGHMSVSWCSFLHGSRGLEGGRFLVLTRSVGKPIRGRKIITQMLEPTLLGHDWCAIGSAFRSFAPNPFPSYSQSHWIVKGTKYFPIFTHSSAEIILQVDCNLTKND